jgi:hypothetical protein
VNGVVYTVPDKPWVHYLHEPTPNGTVIVHRLPATHAATALYLQTTSIRGTGARFSGGARGYEER